VWHQICPAGQADARQDAVHGRLASDLRRTGRVVALAQGERPLSAQLRSFVRPQQHNADTDAIKEQTAFLDSGDNGVREVLAEWLDGMLRGTIGHVLMMAAINMADLGVLKQTASSIFEDGFGQHVGACVSVCIMASSQPSAYDDTVRYGRSRLDRLLWELPTWPFPAICC
jgi:hypothetical protein